MLINSEKQILLVRRKKRPLGWALPGGKIYVGEPHSVAVLRETLEEVNIRLLPSSSFPASNFLGATLSPWVPHKYAKFRHRFLYFVYIFHEGVDFSDNPVNMEPHNHSKVGYSSLDSILANEGLMARFSLALIVAALTNTISRTLF